MIPRIEVFDKEGNIVGLIESGPYQGPLPNTLIRFHGVKVSGPGKHAAPEDMEMPELKVSVSPTEIAGLYFFQDGHASYVPVVQPQAMSPAVPGDVKPQ